MGRSEFFDTNQSKMPFTEAPAVCVEVLSPSNSKAEIAMTTQLYFDAGASEIWACADSGAMEFRNKQGALDRSELVAEFPTQVS